MIKFQPIPSPLVTGNRKASTARPSQRILGIDVGGANLKFSHQGCTASCPFAMWREHQSLADRIQIAVAEISFPPDAVAVTMTGELADCFATRRAGVQHILDHLLRVFPEDHIFVYSVDGQWLEPGAARQYAWDVAASNWHALASWLGKRASENDTPLDLLVDIGSTTVDVIPLREGRVATPARTDRQRMQLNQLVYTGCERTPIAAIADHVMLQGSICPLMAERFADSLDAYLVLGLVAEDPSNTDTADGRGRTRVDAQARLARMVGEDRETLPIVAIESMANQVVAAQAEIIEKAIRKNLASDARKPAILFCGHGNHLIDRIGEQLSSSTADCVKLEHTLGASATRNATAIAVASLLEQKLASTWC